MKNIDLGASTKDGTFIFRGYANFVPRIGEKVIVGVTKYIVKDVVYYVRSIGDSKAMLELEEVE